MSKKEFPLSIHKDLNNLRRNFFSNLEFTSSKTPLMKFKDLDESSNFYFLIKNYKEHNNIFYYDIEYKPINENKLGLIHELLIFADLEKRIQTWLDVINKFDETPHFSEDPIVEKYTAEYYDEHKLLDADADVEPFDLHRQILIDKYLDRAILFLQEYQKKNGDDLTEPKMVAIELKNKLTQLTKNQVVKQLSKLWAISRKKGIPILKEVFFEFAKDVVISLGKQWLGLP